MRLVQRTIGAIVLVALCINLTIVFAQEETTDIVGSGIVLSVISDMIDASEIDNITTTTTGTSRGFEQFCNGEVSATVAPRAISIEEDANCTTNAQEYIELLLGHNLLAVIANVADESIQCLSINEIAQMTAPSARGSFTNWAEIRAEYPDAPLNLVLPTDSSLVYVTLDGLIEGDGLRRDANTANSDVEIIEAVQATSGTLGIINFSSVSATAEVRTLQISSQEAGCIPPSAANAETGLYNFGNRLFMYVDTDSLTNPTMENLLNFLVSDEAGSAVTDNGFTVATQPTILTNRSIISGDESGRQFSLNEVDFETPEFIFGDIIIGGSANAFQFLNSIGGSFGNENPNVSLEYEYRDVATGVEQLCAGELSIAVVNRTVSDEALATCSENNLETYNFMLGTQATVLLANASNEQGACLTTEQVRTIWGSPSTDTVNNWSDLGEGFTDLEMILFGINEGTVYSDILLASSEGAIMPVRVDTEINFDPLYRAAATANVEGALTYMSWQDYQRVNIMGQENIQLVAIDAGDGCVTPSQETILDGSYGLTRSANILTSANSLSEDTVQSYLWFLYSDVNFTRLSSQGFIGLDFSTLPEIRDELQRSFALAKQAAEEAALAEASDETEATSGTEEITDDTEATSDTEEVSDETDESSDDTEAVSDTEDVTDETDASDTEATSDTEEVTDETDASTTEATSDTEEVTDETDESSDDTEATSATEESTSD